MCLNSKKNTLLRYNLQDFFRNGEETFMNHLNNTRFIWYCGWMKIIGSTIIDVDSQTLWRHQPKPSMIERHMVGGRRSLVPGRLGRNVGFVRISC